MKKPLIYATGALASVLALSQLIDSRQNPSVKKLAQKSRAETLEQRVVGEPQNNNPQSQEKPLETYAPQITEHQASEDSLTQWAAQEKISPEILLGVSRSFNSYVYELSREHFTGLSSSKISLALQTNLGDIGSAYNSLSEEDKSFMHPEIKTILETYQNRDLALSEALALHSPISQESIREYVNELWTLSNSSYTGGQVHLSEIEQGLPQEILDDWNLLRPHRQDGLPWANPSGIGRLFAEIKKINPQNPLVRYDTIFATLDNLKYLESRWDEYQRRMQEQDIEIDNASIIPEYKNYIDELANYRRIFGASDPAQAASAYLRLTYPKDQIMPSLLALGKLIKTD